jgi:hypothetical protein
MTAISKPVPRDAGQSTLGSPAAGSPAAIVRGRKGLTVHIGRAGETLSARIAFSCLVQPEAGDLVATQDAGGSTWITAILERPTETPMRLLAEGDVSIASAHGNISIAAAGRVQVDAGEAVGISGDELELQASVARFILDEHLQIGRRATYYVQKIRTAGQVLEQIAETVLTRARNLTRFVEESDQLRAGDVDHRAEGTMQLRAKTAFVTADDLVRLDAEQIHMG